MRLGTFSWKNQKGLSWCGTAAAPVHADPVNEDPLRTYQRTHGVQQGVFSAGLQFPRPASVTVLPDVLVQHYIGYVQTPQGRQRDDKDEIQPKVKPNPAQPTTKDSGVLLKLMYPLHRPHAFSSLQHLTHLAITDILTVLTSWLSQGLWYATCRTTPSRYEGSNL